MERIIMHYDMDAFYASIEINKNPKLKKIKIENFTQNIYFFIKIMYNLINQF